MSEDLRHGGALDVVAARFPRAPTPWVDLSTGINPWSWPLADLDLQSLHQLPDRKAIDRCREAMAQAFSAPASALTPVPGSEIVIRLLPKLLHARRVSVLAPSYADHAQSWAAAGAQVAASSDPLAALDEVDVAVLCNPNNPDGRQFAIDELLVARERIARRRGWLIVDEAYADLEPARSLAPWAGLPGLIILRSTGKFFGLAGLRLGALLGPRALIQELESLLGQWRISGPALMIGARVYADLDGQRAMRERLATARAQLDAQLKAASLWIVGGTDLFRFVEVNDAHATWHALCSRGIYTRRFDWTRSHLRIGLPGTKESQARLIDALAGCH